MSLQKILASKRALRTRLAAAPIGEKLRMLDALRERELAIRGRDFQNAPPPSNVVREEPGTLHLPKE